MTPRRILITGCSAGGKSTLLSTLAARGWQVAPEPGRRIVEAATGPDDPTLPWNDMASFARAALTLATRDWEAAGDGITFFDRGIPDATLGLRRAGITDAAAEAALSRCPYDAYVLAPPWPELFTRDAARRHGFDDAIAEYDHIAQVLGETGHAPLILPKTPPEARADWLEAALGLKEHAQ